MSHLFEDLISKFKGTSSVLDIKENQCELWQVAPLKILRLYVIVFTIRTSIRRRSHQLGLTPRTLCDVTTCDYVLGGYLLFLHQ